MGDIFLQNWNTITENNTLITSPAINYSPAEYEEGNRELAALIYNISWLDKLWRQEIKIIKE